MVECCSFHYLHSDTSYVSHLGSTSTILLTPCRYNSTILTTVGARDYVAVTVDSSFASGLSWNASVVLPKLNDTNREDLYNIALSLQEKAIAGNLVAMDNGTCHSLYSKGAANTKWGNVLLVSPELNQTSGEAGNTSTVAAFFPGLVPSPGKYHTYAWDVNYEFNVWDAAWDLASTWQAPAADCILDDSILCASNTSFSAVPVGECLIDEVPEMCTVSINIAFLIVVIVSTALKAGSLILGRRKDDFAPLTTTGDAMASFIITPDPCTAGLGPLSVLEIPKDGLRSDSTAAACSIYGRQYRWFQAPAKWRWYIGTLSMLIPLGLGGFCLYWSLTGTMGTGFFTNAPTNNPNLVVESTGLLSGPSIITFAHSFAGMAFTVNAVQLLLSSIYFCVNDLLTSMTLAHEYHSYAVQRKPLRVTRSQGLQRSTYFLSMPNKYAIPLVAVWTLLHWAIAASLSLTRVDVYTHDGILDEARSYTGMVVSSDWLWEVWAASLFVVISLVLLGVRKLKKGVPLTRSCSLAISAACHRSPQEGSNMVFLPLQYGVLTDIGNAKHDGLQCVGFSAQDVMPLDPGCSYTSYSHSDIGEPFSEGATNFYSDAVK